MMIPIAGWVAPFGYPRINACSRLPMAFRSVPRPSSPPGAKASTECPSRAHTAEPVRKTRQTPHHAREPATHPGSPGTRRPPSRVTPHTKTALLNVTRIPSNTSIGTRRAPPGQTGRTPRPRSAPEPMQLPTNTRPVPPGGGTGRSQSSATTTPPGTHTGIAGRATEAGETGMETIGIEPMTPCLQSRCSPS